MVNLHSHRRLDKEPVVNILQNIPSHVQEIRTMFVPGYTKSEIELFNDSFTVRQDDLVQLFDGDYVLPESLKFGDKLLDVDTNEPLYVSHIKQISSNFEIFVSKNKKEDFSISQKLNGGD